MNQLLRLLVTLDFAEEGLEELVLRGWSGMKERLCDESLSQLASRCINLKKLKVSKMYCGFNVDPTFEIVRHQLLNLTESIIRSSSGQLKKLDLNKITYMSPLSEHDKSLLAALV